MLLQCVQPTCQRTILLFKEAIVLTLHSACTCVLRKCFHERNTTKKGSLDYVGRRSEEARKAIKDVCEKFIPEVSNALLGERNFACSQDLLMW